MLRKAKASSRTSGAFAHAAPSADFYNPVREWQRYMVDLYLLAECHAFVGSFQSNAARLAVSLMAANKNSCARPFFSGDMNWCWAYGRTGPEVNRVNSTPTGSTATC